MEDEKNNEIWKEEETNKEIALKKSHEGKEKIREEASFEKNLEEKNINIDNEKKEQVEDALFKNEKGNEGDPKLLANQDKKEDKKLIGKEEAQLIWFFVVVGVVFASFLIPYFYIEGLKQFEYKGVDWVIEDFAGEDIFHGQFFSINKEGLLYNLYVRNDPRESDTLIDAEFGHFTVGGHISVSQEIDTVCRGQEVTRMLVDLGAFLLSGIGMDEVNASSHDEAYALQTNIEYVDCNTFENQTIIKLTKGEESSITQSAENRFCYTVTIADCNDIVPIETFMVESIGAFNERDIFAPVENISNESAN